MNILNICKDDWANFAYDNARALRSVGQNVECLKLNPHQFEYENECRVAPVEEIRDAIRDADVVQIFHSDTTFALQCKQDKKHTIVYHTGSHYRANYKMLNDVFNPFVKRSVIALPEFDELGSKRRVYCVGAVDVPGECVINQQRPYIFGHFPSNPSVKGTDEICKMMYRLQGDARISQFRHSNRLTTHEDQLKRIDQCDIYIELFKKELNGKKYGSFGISALEAAARGKIVITMNLSQRVYKRAYGDCALLICNDVDSFIKTIINLQFMEIDSIDDLRRRSRNWIVDKHSFIATGNYIVKNILS